MPAPDRDLHRAASEVPYFSADGDTYLAQTLAAGADQDAGGGRASEEDVACRQTYGYIVVKQAIPAESAKNLLDFAWEFQGLDRGRPETWYEEREFRSDLDRELHIYGFVEAYHHQLIWDSRQTQRVYDAFTDVWTARSSGSPWTGSTSTRPTSGTAPAR
ncbi:hypothetical protein SALBM135S_07268 [Streptomyces alboniger]